MEFTVMGIPCLGLNGGPAFEHNEAFSFQVATEDQAETDRLWDAIVGNGEQESACGWCKDKWGLSPKEIQAAIDAFYVWHARLVAGGRFKSGQRLAKQRSW